MKPMTGMTIRERNKRKRLIGWIVIYLLVITVFILALYWQSRRVNTLDFASGTLQLTVPKSQFTVGDPISYTLQNGLNQPITFTDACPQEPLYVYAWTNNSWVRIHDTASSSSCAGKPNQQTIPTGGSYTQSLANWPNLFSKPGIYRIVLLASNYTALPYTDFRVVAKPTASTGQTQIIIQKVITPVYITVPGGGRDD